MSNHNAFPPSSPELLPLYGQEIELHNSEMQLAGGVLVDRAQAIQAWAINGDVLAIVKLPSDPTKGRKDLAIVDYGEGAITSYAFADRDGPITFLGTAPSRYGLVGLTHAPADAPADAPVASLPIMRGETNIGRNPQSYRLGLAPGEENVARISRHHLTLQLSEQGHITITDHSSRGTVVEVPKFGTATGTYRDSERADTSSDDLFPEQYKVETEALLELKEWQQMRPNFEDARNLEPKDISPELMLAAINALKHATTQTDRDPVIVEGFGKLWPTRSGESKAGFMFVRPDGKRMHILVDSGYSVEPQVQTNPKIYVRQRGFHLSYGTHMEYGAYSDARTYVSLVMESASGEDVGVHFQEYGGSTSDQSPNPIKRVAAAVRAKRYIANHGYKVGDETDFDQARHYLRRGGQLAVIDIGVACPEPKSAA